MIKYNIDITQLKINDEVRFELPYLDSKLKFKGTVISIKAKTLEIEYKTCIGDLIFYTNNIFTTEMYPPHQLHLYKFKILG
jgi:hypothetical protein